MAPVDWGRVVAANVDEMDENQSDSWYKALAEFDPGNEEDPSRLKKLYLLTQAVMNAKAIQADIAEEELDKQIGKTAKLDAHKEREYLDEIEDLKQEVKQLKRSEGAGGGGGGTRFLREEVHELERQIDVLQRELKERDKAVNEEKRTTERYITKMDELEKEMRELKHENNTMQEDIRDYKNQLSSQREGMMSRRDGDIEYREKITKKNRDLVEALEEIQNLTDANVQLQDHVEDMKKKVAESITQMDKTTDEYVKLKKVLQTTDSAIDDLRRENEMLKAQIGDLNEQVQSKGDADDEIMVAVNSKVNEWKQILEEKDQEINEYQESIMKLREQLMAAKMDTDKASVAVLTKAVDERDKQLELLQSKLDQATSDIETQTAIIEDLKVELKKDGRGPSERQHQRIKELQDTMKYSEHQIKDADQRAIQAEGDAREKDKHLSDALERMKQYEAGEYGLAEAVAEIKESKNQINIRDRQIEELTQHVNRNELQLNDLWEENEALRERLGIEPKAPVDLSQFREKSKMRQQEDRALNQVLQKEVERLEEERIELKQKIRKLAQQAGQRAVALGLTADDMMAIDDFTEQLARRHKDPASIIKQEAESDVLKLKALQLDKDLDKNQRELERSRAQNSELRAKLKAAEEENRNLEKGMKEIHEAIKEQNEEHGDGPSTDIQCPTLERMLAAIDAKHMLGHYDTSMHLKAQVDNLQGRNDELRKELKEARFEATKAQMVADKAQAKLNKLEEDLKVLRDAGAGGGVLQSFALPEGMAPTSADVIATLNEHLVLVIQELSLKEEIVSKMEDSLQTYKRKFAVMRHHHGLLYNDFIEEKKKWNEDQEKLEKDLTASKGARDEDNVRLQEYDRMLDTLGQDEVEVRRRLADMARKITVLRVNEKALTRRYNTMVEVEASMRKETNRLKNDIVVMETSVMERIGYLQRHKDMATFKIMALQKALDESVPASDLEAANKQFNALTEKYRDLLEKGNTLVATAESTAGLESEIKRLTNSNNALQKELEIEKEKLHALEAAMEELGKQGIISGSKGARDSDILSISKKLTMLEMKELNERQRAEHAKRLYEQQKDTMKELEERNRELEDKFQELTKLNIDAQKIERELRDELSNCVLKSVSDADRKRIEQLEELESYLKIEVDRLKEIAEVGTMQAMTFEAQQTARDKEVLSLRQQLTDIQAQSDEKTIIGKLHRHIVLLQVSEGTAVRKLENAQKNLNKLNAKVLRLEHKIDEKDQTIYHNRVEARNKAKHLKRTVQELRRQFSGAVPLSRQEKFARLMIQLSEDKNNIERRLKEVNEQRDQVEDKLAELELQHTSLQDLIATLKDGKGASKVMEWHTKMESLRLDDLKQKRQIGRNQQQNKHLDNINKANEGTITELEEENVKQAKEYEERQLQWEQREVELERIISSMEKQQADIADAASQFEEAAGTLPDNNLPIANQLEQAILTIKKNVRVILETRAESKSLKKQCEELKFSLREAESNIISRDKVIAELRYRLPATAERDEMILKATSHAQGSSKEDYESRQALKVAHSTISSLQARITQKEETIQKYQELLKQTREDMHEMNQKHDEELKAMQIKLHSKNDAAFSKFRQTAMELVNKPQEQVPNNKQLAKLNELEDTVAEQDNAMAALSEKLKHTREEAQNRKKKIEDMVKAMKLEKENLVQEHKEVVNSLDQRLAAYKEQLSEQERELEIVKVELESQKDANAKAPTTTMKQLVDRLKKQLEQKEKQHKALSKALVDLRGDMVSQAQEQVKAHAEEAKTEANVQKLIDKHTKELQDQADDLTNQLQKSKKDSKRRKERENAINSEVEELKQDLGKRDNQISRLKADKQKLEDEVEELEKKLERLTASRTLKTGEQTGYKQECDDLKRKVRLLEDELKRKHQPAEKPYELHGTKDHSKDPKLGGDEAVVRWEESKKWQKTVDKLKTKLKERETECEKLQKSNELMKNALDRSNRDKDSLEGRLKTVSKTSTGWIPTSRETHSAQDLRKKNYELEEQVTELKRQLTQSKDAAFEEVQLRNKYLNDKLDELERQLARKTISGQGPGLESTGYQQLYDKQQKLQKDFIKISEENIELRFEVEQANKDIPRFKERIESLQNYVEALKSDNQHSARSITPSGNIRRIGESGKSTKDLEKTIALLKKVVERTQQENEQLKKAPGIVSNEHLQDLQMENDGLKNQLEELRQRMGATLSERYQSTQKGTAKIMTDYERLRKDLKKETDLSGKLRIQVRNLEMDNDKLRTVLDESKTKLEIEQAKRPSLSSLDSKGWKSVVVTRMYEEKLRGLEGEMHQKVQQINDLKTLLRDSAEREQNMIHEKEVLEERIAVLEEFPEGSYGQVKDSDLVKKYQTARLTIDRLEKEKEELIHELHIFGHQPNRSADLANEDVLAKLRLHDRTLKESIELRTQLKTVEFERDKMRIEVNKLKKELENFGPDFFEEIEDLKYNYREAMERNVQYEEQLRQLSKQFGVAVNIPTSDDND